MTVYSILFFADRLPPLTGGMEIHASYFIQHFIHHPFFPIVGVVSKNDKGEDCLITEEGVIPIGLEDLPDLFQPDMLFFNSGRWIEDLQSLKGMFRKAIFFYRTGGNEILKASLVDQKIPDHSMRQSYWVHTLNHTIDYLITNSAYTEKRLLNLGITCPLARCVGGVNAEALQPVPLDRKDTLTVFCAARFVPYKNHALLLSVVHALIVRGHKLQVRLAGEGPLMEDAQNQVFNLGLESVVEFLGVLDNQEVCEEITHADIYMQLSGDQLTQVPEGSYIHSEGMGRSILEALTAGTFVIAGQSGALSEIVKKDCGLLLEMEDVDGMIDRIEEVLKKLPHRSPFTDQFSWKNVFNLYEELFEGAHESSTSYRKV